MFTVFQWLRICLAIRVRTNLEGETVVKSILNLRLMNYDPIWEKTNAMECYCCRHADMALVFYSEYLLKSISMERCRHGTGLLLRVFAKKQVVEANGSC